MLVIPGFSSARVPIQIRLFIALAVTLAVTPLVAEKFLAELKNHEPFAIFAWIVSETLTGLLIGLLGRIFFVALQTLVVAATMAMGFGSIPGVTIEESEPMPAIGSLIMMAATTMIFLTDLHWELFRGLIASYSRLPPGEFFGAQSALIQIADQLAATFVLALRISSPFIVYSIIVNLAVGLANKLTPTIPVYFISTPFVLVGGLIILYFVFNEFMLQFMASFMTWLIQG